MDSIDAGSSEQYPIKVSSTSADSSYLDVTAGGNSDQWQQQEPSKLNNNTSDYHSNGLTPCIESNQEQPASSNTVNTLNHAPGFSTFANHDRYNIDSAANSQDEKPGPSKPINGIIYNNIGLFPRSDQEEQPSTSKSINSVYNLDFASHGHHDGARPGPSKCITGCFTNYRDPNTKGTLERPNLTSMNGFYNLNSASILPSPYTLDLSLSKKNVPSTLTAANTTKPNDDNHHHIWHSYRDTHCASISQTPVNLSLTPTLNEAHNSKSTCIFTSFQLKQLNHQMRMYRLIILLEQQRRQRSLQVVTLGNTTTRHSAEDFPSSNDYTGMVVQIRPSTLSSKISETRLFRPDTHALPLDLTPTVRLRLPIKSKRAAPKAKLLNGNSRVKHEPVRCIYLECAFCVSFVAEGESTKLESCQHVFCRNCLRSLIEHSTEPHIPCPVKEASNCDGYLLDPEIKELVSDEVFQTYLSRSLTKALMEDNSLSHCYVSGCSGICVIEGNLRSFYCPVCSKLNCLDCKSTHDRPCRKRKTAPEGENEDGVPDNSDIAMKCAKAETPAEAELRQEWETSWQQLCTKFQAERNNGISITEGAEDQENKDYEDQNALHLKMFKSDLITTDKEFECPICILDISVGEGIILQECFHRFCRQCLAASVEHSNEPQVKCPFQSGNYSCPMYILDREIKSLVTEEVYDKLLNKSLSAAEVGMTNSFHCQSVNCTGWCEVEPGVPTFKCFICQKQNCVPCKAIHESISCAEYQSRLREGECDDASKMTLNTMIDNGTAMRCPTCKVVIIKNDGCDGITCTICRTSLCWATKGPRWGPKGHGDTSGGCRCGVNGKKCTPKCGYCH